LNAPLSLEDVDLQGTTTGWNPPIPFDDEPLAVMPADILPGDIGRYTAALSLATETPPELATLMVLGAISCALGGKIAVEAEPGYIEPAHLYVCCALESGSRKTAVVNAATAPLSSWEIQERKRLESEIQRVSSERKTAEAIVEKIRRSLDADPEWGEETQQLQGKIADLEANLPVVPVAPLLWTSDSTPEKIECLLAQHGERFAVISDEGGIFDILGGRYSKGMNLDMFLKGHAGSPVRVHRTSREEVMLEKPALTMAISPQPGVLRELQSNAAFRHRGMLARILFALPPSNVGDRKLIPNPIPTSVHEAYSRAIERMLDWQPEERLVLALSGTSYLRWKEFQRQTELDMRDGEMLCRIRDWGSKLPGATLRMAGLLHAAIQPNLSNLSLEIAQPTIEIALMLGRVFISHALAVFRLISEDSDRLNAKRVLAWIVQQNSPQVSKRDCFRAHQHLFGKVEGLDAILRILEARKMIRIGSWSTSTKSGETIEVNPALLVAD